MKKRRIWLSALALAISGGLAWWLAAQREPRYQGKPLSEWLSGYHLANPDRFTSEPHADEAVRALGAKAIPTLLRLIAANDSPLKLRLIELAQKQLLVRITHVPAYEKNLFAEYGFFALGPKAQAAVPALAQILDRRVSQASGRAVAW